MSAEKSNDQAEAIATGEGMPEPSNSEKSGKTEIAANGSVESVSNGTDLAPFGFKKDGTPRKSNAGRRSEPKPDSGPGQSVEPVEKESIEAKHERLAKVRPSTRSEQQPTSPVLTMAAGIDHTALGKDAAVLWVTVGSMLFGQEWAPDANPDGTWTQEGRSEMIALRDAFGGYFKAKNIDKIPAEVALAITLTVYVGKRAQKPAVRQRLANGWAWVKALPSKALGVFRRG